MSVFHIRCSLALVLLPLAAAAGSGRPADVELLTGRIVGLSDSAQALVEGRYKASVDTSRVPGHEELLLFYRAGKVWREIVDVAVLKRMFPDARFYSVMAYTTWPAARYLLAEYKTKFYSLPDGFNKLLWAHGDSVTSKNIADCAKAYASLRLVARPPSDTSAARDGLVFRAEVVAAKAEKVRAAGDWWDFTLRLSVAGKEETWRFRLFRGGFGSVLRGSFTYSLSYSTVRDGTIGAGERLEIDGAAVEYDSSDSVPHYYCAVRENGVPDTPAGLVRARKYLRAVPAASRAQRTIQCALTWARARRNLNASSNLSC